MGLSWATPFETECADQTVGKVLKAWKRRDALSLGHPEKVLSKRQGAKTHPALSLG